MLGYPPSRRRRPARRYGYLRLCAKASVDWWIPVPRRAALMVGVFRLLTRKRIALAFVVVLIAAGVAGRLAAAAESEGPSASFTFDPGRSAVEREITRSRSTSTDDGDPIVSEPGTSATASPASGSDVNHTYAVPGVYTVKLTVTDDESLTATHSETRDGREPQPERRLPLHAGLAAGRRDGDLRPRTRPIRRTGSRSSAGTSTTTAAYETTRARPPPSRSRPAARTRSRCWSRTGTAAPTRSARRST